jgi:hypothetical protein
MTFGGPALSAEILEGGSIWRAGTGPRVLGIAGPPTSALLYRHLARPIVAGGRSLVLPELFHPAPPSASLRDVVARLVPLVEPDTVVVAHGLGLPVGIALAAKARPRGLVLLDGPLQGFDPVTRAALSVAKGAPALLRGLLRPRIAVPALSSSAAFRRTVVNPYVMDRDIVAMLTAPLLATRDHRRAVAEFLASIADLRPPWDAGGVPALLLWSASDLLYPLPDDPAALLPGSEVRAISLPGARFLNVEERPWEIADALLAWAGAVPGEADHDTDVAVFASGARASARGRR